MGYFSLVDIRNALMTLHTYGKRDIYVNMDTIFFDISNSVLLLQN